MTKPKIVNNDYDPSIDVQLKIVCDFIDDYRDILSEKDIQQIVNVVKNVLPKRPNSVFVFPIKDTNKAIRLEFVKGIAKKLTVLIEGKNNNIVEMGYILPEEKTIKKKTA